MIGIIDYGLGNIKAISNIYDKLKIKNSLVQSKSDFETVEKLILPGVGSFDSAMQLLTKKNFKDVINSVVLEKKKKILGICVGMQTFAKNSEEGLMKGLSWVEGEVKKFEFNNNTRLPHMGWNSIKKNKENPLFKNIENNEYFYFCHSYYFKCKINEDILTQTSFGINFTSSINFKNIYGIQFHPEKSHDSGITILKNFAEL